MTGFRRGAPSPQSCSPWTSLNSFLSVYIEQKWDLGSHWTVLRLFHVSKNWDQASQQQNVEWNKTGCLVCNSAFNGTAFAWQGGIYCTSCLRCSPAAGVWGWLVWSAPLGICDSQGIKLKGLIIINFRSIFQLRGCRVSPRFQQIALYVILCTDLSKWVASAGGRGEGRRRAHYCHLTTPFQFLPPIIITPKKAKFWNLRT